MGVTPSVDISTDQRKIVLDLLKTYIPNTKVWAYGSRVKWTSRPQSDLDMAVFTTPEQIKQVSNLKDAFEESDLPFRVDLFVWDEVPEQFHKNIEAEHVVLQEKEERVFEGRWKYIRLGDCGKWLSGGTPSKTNSSYWNGNIPWISARSMQGSRYADSNLKVTELGAENGTRRIPINTILLLVRGSILHQRIPVGITTREVTFNQDVKALIPSDDFDPQFLLYWFLANELFLLSKVDNTGIGAGKLSTDILFDLQVPVPSLREQRAIAHILGTLDDKIELNRNMNETLEAMAQALFKSWFVDFDPVIDNALASGKPIPEGLKKQASIRESLGDARKPLPQEIQELFPDEFEHNEELGWIPKGWETDILGNITSELRRGISPKYIEQSGVRVINQRCIRNHIIDFSLTRRNDPNLRKVGGRYLEIGDVLINSTGVGTLGRMAQVLELEEPTVVDSHITVLRPNINFFKPFIFGRLLLSIELKVESMGEGSTGQTELGSRSLSNIRIIKPKINCQSFIESYFYRQAEKIARNQKQISVLSNLRDTLLPKLLSGELRISEVEKFVEAI